MDNPLHSISPGEPRDVFHTRHLSDGQGSGERHYFLALRHRSNTVRVRIGKLDCATGKLATLSVDDLIQCLTDARETADQRS